ncbi:MAG: phosphate acyltransferase PlsX [Chloroflexi bacterium]|nr:phosphate acyltransferase PlsX [Chloroflexota bacterium]
MVNNAKQAPQTTDKTGSPTFTVALDTMGGDFGPSETVPGAIKAARDLGVDVLLVGDEAAVQREMDRCNADGLSVHLVPSQGVIEETDHPLQAMRDKPRASVVEAAKLVRAGQAQAMVSMGSTGATMATAALVYGLLEGVDRPAIGGPFLAPLSNAIILDLGSNVDCRPAQLLGFGAIGVAFSRRILGVQDPRVGILSVGAEEGKGNRQVKDAYQLFKQSSLNFVGNIEGIDVFQDKADVIVCDGFVGNVLLKFAEGLGMAIARRLAGAASAGLPPQAMQKLGGELSAMTNIVELGGGGPLFGVNGIAVVGHGRSRAASIANGIALAKKATDLGLVEAIKQELLAIQPQLKARA